MNDMNSIRPCVVLRSVQGRNRIEKAARMIFQYYHYQLLTQIELTIEYHSDKIEIDLQWSPGQTTNRRWSLSYIDDEFSLSDVSPCCYLFSSSSSSIHQSIQPSFYSYWFVLNSSLYRRLFSQLINDEDHFVILICLPDGRILSFAQVPKANARQSIVWFTSSSNTFLHLFALHYEANTNLIDAVLAASEKPSIYSTIVSNHLIIAESIGTLFIFSSTNFRRILLDNAIKSICHHVNQILYLTRTELRSISLPHLFKSSNEEIFSQSKIVRFGHFKRLLTDGQEVILFYENGTFERLNNLYARSMDFPVRMESLTLLTKRLTRLTETITHLQSNACSLQRFLKKIESFYQCSVQENLQFIGNHWKFHLNEQQSRLFQPNDFLLIILCQTSSNRIHIEQLICNDRWIFPMKSSLKESSLCQPILFLRHHNEFHHQLGSKQILLPYQESSVDEHVFSLENLFPKKFKTIPRSEYHLTLILRNEAATNFKKINVRLARQVYIGRFQPVKIDFKQHDIKVDTDHGLVDSTTVQIVISNSCLQRLLLFFSIFIERFYVVNNNVDEKNFLKQNDHAHVLTLIEDLQKKLLTETFSDDIWLNLLQIRIYLSMFRLGSNYTVQVS